MNVDDLKAAIEKETTEYWKNNKKPLLLSGLVPHLESHNFRLKDVIGEQRIKDFIQQTSSKGADYKLIVDPVHKAKVGVIPSNESYSYTPVILDIEGRKTNQKITMEFLALVSKLPKEEAQQVHIPTHVLAKLLNS